MPENNKEKPYETVEEEPISALPIEEELEAPSTANNDVLVQEELEARPTGCLTGAKHNCSPSEPEIACLVWDYNA